MSVPPTQPPPGVGVSSTASTVQGEGAVVKSKDPGWKYCICPDTIKKNSLRCIYCHNVYTNGITRIKLHLAHIPNSGVSPCLKVSADVKDEILQFLTKKGDKKAVKVTEQKRRRSEVDLSHSEGEGSSEEDGGRNSAVVLKSSKSARSKSTSGPMDKFCELTPEETVAARSGKFAEKIQSKLTTEKRVQKRNRTCEYICQFFYEACIPFNAVKLPSFDLMLQSIGQYGEDLQGPSAYEMGGPFLQKRKKKVEESFKAHRQCWELTGCTVMYSHDSLMLEDIGKLPSVGSTIALGLVGDGKTQDKILDEIEEYKNEEGSFGRDMAKRQRRNKSFDPAKWWSSHGSSAPNLRVLAMRILSLTCSSSACERNFSVFQQIHTKRRNRLLSSKLRDLVFIKFNSKLNQKRGMINKDPIEVTIYADVVEDEGNEWITGIVPEEVVQIGDEPEGLHVEASTSEGARTTSKGKRVSHPRKKLLPVLRDDEVQSGSSSESEDDTMALSDDSC